MYPNLTFTIELENHHSISFLDLTPSTIINKTINSTSKYGEMRVRKRDSRRI